MFGGDIFSAYRGFGWLVYLLPHMEHLPVFKSINFDEPVVGQPNPIDVNPNETFLTSIAIPILLCPSDIRSPNDSGYEGAPNLGSSSYVGNFGVHGYVPGHVPQASWSIVRYFGGVILTTSPGSLRNHRGVGPLFSNSHVRFRDISDGTSATVLAGERRGGLNRSIPSYSIGTASQCFWAGIGNYPTLSSAYYRPNKCDLATPQSDLDGCVGNFSSWHPGGLNVCLMDGSVRFISENIESASEADLDALPSMTGPERRDVYGIWQALCDINDGMVIGEF
ncbi:MAG: DUF1559 domain-containing protein [Planctomycetaceae bacterium]